MISANSLLAGGSGKLQNIVVKHYGDKTVVTSKPDMSRRKLSPKQKEQNDRMKMAILCAKRITGDERLKQRACDFLKVEPNKVFRAVVSHFLLTDRFGTSELFQKTEQEKRDLQTLKEMKSAIVTVIPDAEVKLFGDKAKAVADPHGHWDLLVLTKSEHPSALRWELQEKLFAITSKQGSNVNVLLVQKERWQSSPEYELLRERIEGELVPVE